MGNTDFVAVQMRSVIISSSFLLLGGCATVSMVSGEATVETSLNANQTALRLASDEFCDQLENEGWVNASGGLAGLASILMNGRDSGKADTNTYLAQFEAEDTMIGNLTTMLVEDVEQVRIGLSAVTGEANTVLADTEARTERGDVTSYERALVKAQRARRTFLEARDTLAERTNSLTTVDAALESLATEIDASRRVADDLAARYASIGQSAV